MKRVLTLPLDIVGLVFAVVAIGLGALLLVVALIAYAAAITLITGAARMGGANAD